MRRALGIERIEANREKVLAWAAAGRPYFWIARQIGLGERNASAVSHWLVKQGIRRKAADVASLIGVML